MERMQTCERLCEEELMRESVFPCFLSVLDFSLQRQHSIIAHSDNETKVR